MVRLPVKGKDKEIKDNKKRISIAMQGGGAHGAYTWGVLDRLLQEKDLVIEGVSGTSAGGMNAVATAQGLVNGGNEGARQLLSEYWALNSKAGKTSVFKPGLLDVISGKYTMYHSPGFLFMDFITKIFSPYQLNPLGTNPLKNIVDEMFDFDALNSAEDTHKIKIFLAATHVYTGKLKVFSNIRDEMSPEALLASACLPTLFGAVMVKGEYYWDGGFIGNPVIYPLIYDCESPDIMIIKLNPTHRNKLPVTATDIHDRLNEITNNTSIVREMRSMSFITKLIDEGYVTPGKLKRCFVHLIEDEKVFFDLGWSSKLNTDEDFLKHLFDAGRKSADKWLEQNYEKIGKESTTNIADDFI
ncbi:MAG: patatin-like phospholipase family protein [Holosporaceae bacterium]|jgi:NTE family protein|nr:patatin-like phospholipase family protein [Holosporaceae bacterium]